MKEDGTVFLSSADAGHINRRIKTKVENLRVRTFFFWQTPELFKLLKNTKLSKLIVVHGKLLWSVLKTRPPQDSGLLASVPCSFAVNYTGRQPRLGRSVGKGREGPDHPGGGCRSQPVVFPRES